MQKRRVTYLDTNAVSDLSRWRERATHIEGVEAVRRDLCSCAAKRTIALGQWVFSEMAGFESGDRRTNFLSDLAFVEEVQFLHVFRSSGDMMQREVVAFFNGDHVDPVISKVLPATIEDPTLWAEERRQLAELKDEYLRWEDGAEQRIDEWHPDREDRARKLAAEWEQDAHGIVARWVKNQMRENRESLGLPAEEALWPAPERLPTLWCNWAYRITRDVRKDVSLHSKQRRGSERRGSHAVDWCHFMTSAHAHEFVTSDDNFLEIAMAAPGPKPEILSLADWIARLRRE